MRIHITETAPEKAAREVIRFAREHGGEWFANALEDDGYLIARVGTLDGKRLERSFSPCLCGPFSAEWSRPAIASDLRYARAVSLAVAAGQPIPEAHKSNRGRPPKGSRPRVEIALDKLKDKSMTIGELASALSVGRAAARNYVFKLMHGEQIRVIEQRASGSGSEAVFGVAA